MVDGPYPPARPLGSTSQLGDFSEGSSEVDTQEIAFINTDQTVASGPGTVTVHLTHVPIADSLHVRWNGVDQPPTEWTSSSRTVTFPDPDGLVEDLDVFSTAYAYYAYYPPDDEFENLDWGSTGPILIVADGDATDYSSPTFDDSGWTVAPTALGYPLSVDPGSSETTTWPVASTTTGSVNVGFWIRRRVTATADVQVTIAARVDGQHWLYVDGTLVHSYAGAVAGADLTPSVTRTLTEGEHVIALHVNDDTPDPGLDYIYGDLSVTAL
jgi:hypothetical protein